MLKKFKNSENTKNKAIGISLLVFGIYCIGGFFIFNNVIFWTIIGIICIIKGLAFLRVS